MSESNPLFVPTALITDEMRAAGVTEETRYFSREEAVAALGEEKVAEIEASFAVPGAEPAPHAAPASEERFVQTPDVTEGQGGGPDAPPAAPEGGSAPVEPTPAPEAPAGGAEATPEVAPEAPAEVPVSSFVGGHSMAER